MIKALMISFLFHSLAFAGSYFLLGNSFFANDVSELKGNIISVNMVFSPIEKEAVSGEEPALISKDTLQKTRSSVKTSSSVSLMPSSAQPAQSVSMTVSNPGNAQGEEGAANLIPHPSNQPPAYPERARADGLTGKMMIQLTVDQTGRVVHAKVIEGQNVSSILQEAAISAVKEWRFKYKTTPREQVRLSLPIVFNLED
ncbi:MAG: energy transducer TonB [Alphaproteobacteria bacterium]|nr:energy transducer TonB [Alphaproteobacteria bacterium]